MSYDVIVIGAGPVGENVADRAVQGGLKVAIVESELVGGECNYWACMPSKALLRSGIAMRAAQHVSGAAQAVTSGIGVSEVLKRRNYIVSDWSDKAAVGWLNSSGIELLRGRGEITGVKAVKVVSNDGTAKEYTANHAVVISTGSDAMIPDIKGIKDVSPWTSREATSAQKAPESLVIIGGGVVACEMATAWSTLGSKVTLTSRGKLLNNVEPFAGEMVGDALKDLGVDIRIGISPVSVTRSGDVTVEFNDNSTITASEILIATGRTPRTTNIGLETIGIQAGWIPVDETLLVKHDTNQHPWLYATGDVNHRALVTHQGKYQGRAAGDVIVARAKNLPMSTQPWGKHVATADIQSVPQAILRIQKWLLLV
jgi:pyruvate/2-oxoglutarate dehydrogenase complex dihydrolipoamide dehydrogenase (E3) component